MLRAIIIDDEQKGIDTIKILCGKFIPDVNIVAEATKPVDAIALIENYKPEIVFLDIQMPGLDGFELLEKLSWQDFNLVFTTAHQEYALKALKNNAIDYLLKPIDHEDLVKAVARIKHKLEANDLATKFNYNELLQTMALSQRQKIILQSRSGIESLDTNDILMLEATSSHTRVLVPQREILTTKRLKDFETELCTKELGFMRIHHSYIINLKKTLRYLKNSEEIVLQNDIKVPLAKSRKEAFFHWLDNLA
jgi:two-component system, LytTR family, response regulator